MQSMEGFALQYPRRWMSASNPAAATEVAEPKKKDDDDESFLARHGGKVALAAFGISIILLYRYFKSSSLRGDKEIELRERAAVEPYEIHDLRVSNDITAADYVALCGRMFDKFPTGEATYDDFITAVTHHLVNERGKKPLQNMHIMDRIVLDSDATARDGMPQSLRRMLVALNTAVNAVADERIKCLDYLVKRSLSKGAEESLKKDEVVLLLDDLARTWQLPHDKRSIEDESKVYPAQDWRERTPDEIMTRFREAHKKELAERTSQDFDDHDLAFLLKSGAVCVWGECFRRT